MRFALPAATAVAAYAVWHWTPFLLDPLGLGEFLFVARFCLVIGLLTGAESAFHRIVP